MQPKPLPSASPRRSGPRRALLAYGVTPGPEKPKSGYDVIKHLIGSCKGGSTDLATNPRHMEGFGR